MEDRDDWRRRPLVPPEVIAAGWQQKRGNLSKQSWPEIAKPSRRKSELDPSLKSWVCCTKCRLPMWQLEMSAHKCLSVAIVKDVPQCIEDSTGLQCLGCSKYYRCDKIGEHVWRCSGWKQKLSRNNLPGKTSEAKNSKNPERYRNVEWHSEPKQLVPSSIIPTSPAKVEQLPFKLLPPGS
jgi:hypothetical protein